MKNITLSADEKMIESARERARSEHTTLNEQFRRWLAEYAHTRERMQRYDDEGAGMSIPPDGQVASAE